jgi:hypothetical protein
VSRERGAGGNIQNDSKEEEMEQQGSGRRNE